MNYLDRVRRDVIESLMHEIESGFFLTKSTQMVTVFDMSHSALVEFKKALKTEGYEFEEVLDYGVVQELIIPYKEKRVKEHPEYTNNVVHVDFVNRKRL